jgi:hypothetical protein
LPSWGAVLGTGIAQYAPIRAMRASILSLIALKQPHILYCSIAQWNQFLPSKAQLQQNMIKIIKGEDFDSSTIVEKLVQWNYMSKESIDARIARMGAYCAIPVPNTAPQEGKCILGCLLLIGVVPIPILAEYACSSLGNTTIILCCNCSCSICTHTEKKGLSDDCIAISSFVLISDIYLSTSALAIDIISSKNISLIITMIVYVNKKVYFLEKTTDISAMSYILLSLVKKASIIKANPLKTSHIIRINVLFYIIMLFMIPVFSHTQTLKNIYDDTHTTYIGGFMRKINFFIYIYYHSNNE